MKKFSCPSCGAEILFKSSATVFGVCSFCQATLVRRDVNIEAIGKMAELPSDLSPFQVGSQGTFEGKNFEIIGRVKVGWDDGMWNEWYCTFQDGKNAWLVEAQGFVSLCFELEQSSIPPRQNLHLRFEVKIPNRESFFVDDIKDTICLGSEGELPFQAPQRKTGTTIDLSNSKGTFASIEYNENESRIFIGKYTSPKELKMKNLREIEGWPKWMA